MSGEHGDGRARSALLPAMYSPAALDLFAQVKAALDPDDQLNPGVLVDPRPLEADLRAAALIGRETRFATEVHRCTGVGKCLANNTGSLGVMCPSYLATREEKDSTRGRARVLQEMINGDLVQLGWKSPAVHQALDLCLSCKGCARDCPTGRRHGRVQVRGAGPHLPGHAAAAEPLRARLAAAMGPADQRILAAGRGWSIWSPPTPGLRRLVRWSAGVDQRRQLPRFATQRARSRVPTRASGAGSRSWSGWTPSPTASPAAGWRRWSRCWRPPATHPGCSSRTPAAG